MNGRDDELLRTAWRAVFGKDVLLDVVKGQPLGPAGLGPALAIEASLGIWPGYSDDPLHQPVWKVGYWEDGELAFTRESPSFAGAVLQCISSHAEATALASITASLFTTPAPTETPCTES